MSEIELTDENFEMEVLKSEMPVLVDFYADWCGPCKMVAPVVEELANEYTEKVKVGKLNVDKAQGTAVKYQVMSIPMLMFFKGGVVVDKLVGFQSKEVLKGKLDALIGGVAGQAEKAA